jgi:hypothetical protein
MGFDKLSPSGKFRTRNAILRIAGSIVQALSVLTQFASPAILASPRLD